MVLATRSSAEQRERYPSRVDVDVDVDIHCLGEKVQSMRLHLLQHTKMWAVSTLVSESTEKTPWKLFSTHLIPPRYTWFFFALGQFSEMIGSHFMTSLAIHAKCKDLVLAFAVAGYRCPRLLSHNNP